MYRNKIKRHLCYVIHKQTHRTVTQTIGGPPSKSWSLLKCTPQTQQSDFTIKT
jgi:hypothetical protein